MSSRSPLEGYGAKSEACAQFGLHLYLPEFHNRDEIFIEPFCFTASIFFNTNAKSAILNDKDDRIWNFWTVIKDHYDAFCHELEYSWVGAKWVAEYSKQTDPVSRAVAFYLMTKTATAGIVPDKYIYRTSHNAPLHKDLSEWKSRLDNMMSLAIWNLDFREVYEKITKSERNQKTLVIYADPPYIKGGDAYKHTFTEQDHRDLADWHNKMKNLPNYHIFISYDEHPLIRELYDGWYILPVGWHTGACSRKAEEYHELLISNRPLHKRSGQKTMDYLIKRRKEKTLMEQMQETQHLSDV